MRPFHHGSLIVLLVFSNPSVPAGFLADVGDLSFFEVYMSKDFQSRTGTTPCLCRSFIPHSTPGILSRGSLLCVVLAGGLNQIHLSQLCERRTVLHGTKLRIGDQGLGHTPGLDFVSPHRLQCVISPQSTSNHRHLPVTRDDGGGVSPVVT